jgi:hypothetical protein
VFSFLNVVEIFLTQPSLMKTFLNSAILLAHLDLVVVVGGEIFSTIRAFAL